LLKPNTILEKTNRLARNISQRFREALLSVPDDEDVPCKPHEAVDKDALRLSVQKWLEKLGDEATLSDDTPEPMPTRHETFEPTVIPDEQKYRDIAFKSSAFKWLLASLENHVMLTPVQSADASAVLKTRILEALPRSNEVSRRSPSTTHVMRFDCDCNIEAFAHHEYPDIGQCFTIGDVISITGSATEAQALTCSGYMEQTWPTTGLDVLSVVQTALDSDREPISSKHSELLHRIYLPQTG